MVKVTHPLEENRISLANMEMPVDFIIKDSTNNKLADCIKIGADGTVYYGADSFLRNACAEIFATYTSIRIRKEESFEDTDALVEGIACVSAIAKLVLLVDNYLRDVKESGGVGVYIDEDEDLAAYATLNTLTRVTNYILSLKSDNTSIKLINKRIDYIAKNTAEGECTWLNNL